MTSKILGGVLHGVSTFIMILFILVLLVGLCGYSLFRIYALDAHIKTLDAKLASTTAMLAQATERVALLEDGASGLHRSLSQTEQRLAAALSSVDEVKSNVGNISGTVTTLQKLSRTDPELLAKYSKTFFLNENYIPVRLAHIESAYLYNEKRSEQFHAEVWHYLQALMDDAKGHSAPLYVKSAYRSFGTQESLKSTYTVVYGAGTANQFSADQGYSEHQLGTAVDFMTTGISGQLDDFGGTAAYQWLSDNAYRYGFILSYPKNNSYYVYEPWHWRFVGVALATYLHNQNMHFYDLEQRTIDEYLANIFD